jgi:hypothetical protein
LRFLPEDELQDRVLDREQLPRDALSIDAEKDPVSRADVHCTPSLAIGAFLVLGAVHEW